VGNKLAVVGRAHSPGVAAGHLAAGAGLDFGAQPSSAWLLPALVLILPAVFSLIVVPLRPIKRDPGGWSGFRPDHFFRPLTDEELATVDIYKKAFEKYRKCQPKSESETNDHETEAINDILIRPNQPVSLTAQEIAWVKANQQAIPLAVEASKGQKDIFPPSAIYNPGNHLSPFGVFTN